jgi:hypothetical protein
VQPTASAAIPSFRTHALRAAVLSVALAASVLIIPVDERVPYYAVVAGFLACLLVPIWYTTTHRRTFDVFETINVLGVLYLVFYGMGAVWSAGDPHNVAYDIHIVPFLLQAAVYSLLGYLALLAGYFNPLLATPRRQVELWPRTAWFLMIPAGIGAAGCLGRAVLIRVTYQENRIAEFASSLAQLAPLFVVAWGALWIMYLSGQASRSQRRLLYAMMPVAGLVAYATYQSKAIAIVLVSVPIMALWYARRRLPWKTLAVLAFVVVFVIFPFINYFRNLDPYLPKDKRFEITYQTLSSQSVSEYTEGALTGFKERMALVNSVAVVIRDVGRWVPFANGETIFGPTVAFLVPRAIWPDKPYFVTGRDFGILFRVVGATDQLTSIAPTVVGELYWNFDLAGILAGMAVFGVVLKLMYRRYGEGTGLDPIRRAAHMAILVHVTHFDGGIAGHTSGLLRNLVMFEGVIWLGRRLGQLEVRQIEE